MPSNRMLHKRAGSGERTNSLSNLEFRAWIIYRLAADDFGVMRADISALIEAHPYFATEKPRSLRAALERLVNVGLLGRFTWQGLTYVYSRDWQDFERIEWPAMTARPTIPAEFLSDCTQDTQRLFTVWPGQKRVPPSKVATSSLERSDGVATTSPPRANANANATATASEIEPGSGDSLWQSWRGRMSERGVYLPAQPKAADLPTILAICDAVPDSERRSAAMGRLFAMSDVDRKRLGIKALTLGYFKMALPDLLQSGAPSTRSLAAFDDETCPGCGAPGGRCAVYRECQERQLEQEHGKVTA